MMEAAVRGGEEERTYYAGVEEGSHEEKKRRGSSSPHWKKTVMMLVVMAVGSVAAMVVWKGETNISSSSWDTSSEDWMFLKKEGAAQVTLVLSADPGDLIGGYGESHVLLAVGSDLGPDPKSKELFCIAAHRLVVYGSRVLLVTTGIGTTRAALCLDSILRAYGEGIREVVFMGTAGGSPALGGVLDSKDCAEGGVEADADKVVGLGDVCVSSFSTNWDCQKCFWSAEPYVANERSPRPPIGDREKAAAVLDSACVAPPCSLHDRWDIFGDFGCSFFAKPDLVDEMYTAATLQAARQDDDDDTDVLFPPPSPSEVKSLEAAYWDASTGLSRDWRAAAERARKRGPRIWHYTQCAEATSTTYWNGAPYDELARGYVAELVNEALDTLQIHAPPPDIKTLDDNLTRADVVAFSAMEGTGWMSVLRLSEVYLDYAHVPAANVRAVSDYTHDPLIYDPDTGLWFEDSDWLDLPGRLNATRVGYQFAIQTTSAVVLSLFKSRQLARDKKLLHNSPPSSSHNHHHQSSSSASSTSSGGRRLSSSSSGPRLFF